jgi:IclR family pca regulon transcriptional regulator
MGRALLAWSGPERISRFLDEARLVPHTPRTLTDPASLRAALAKVREQGWSIVDGELEEGLISASAPVRDRTGRVVAALASSTSAGRQAPERLEAETVPLLLETAAAISTELGHSSEEPRVARDGFF